MSVGLDYLRKPDDMSVVCTSLFALFSSLPSPVEAPTLPSG